LRSSGKKDKVLRRKGAVFVNSIGHHSDRRVPTLTDKSDPIKCSDNTEQVVVNIPCRLIERAKKYADEHGNTVTGVVIEALDALLGGRTIR